MPIKNIPDGVLRIVQPVYDKFVRDHLPRKYRVAAGVTVRDCPLLDLQDTNPEYKHALLDAIGEEVEDGDHVSLVAFGRGVSTIHCLRAGAERVTAYEAAESMIELGLETLENNYYEGEVDVRHALIGDAIDVYGAFDGAERVSPADLDGDVLVLDCEGAEKSILAGLESWPDTVLCECHRTKGAPAEAVLPLIPDDFDTEVRDFRPGKPGGKDVIIARRRGQ